MKVLIQLQNDVQDNQNKLITRSEVVYDSENFQTLIVEVEDIEVLEGKRRVFSWDKETQTVKAVLEDIPKTMEDKLQEEMDVLKGSIVELTQLALGVV